MKKSIFILISICSINIYAVDYCKKDYMSNIEYATKKVNLNDKKSIKAYTVFSGNKHINRQIAKTTYNYNLYNFDNYKVSNSWIGLTKTYLKNEKEHLGIDLRLSDNTMFLSTLKLIGLMTKYNKKEVKDFYLTLFKTYDFFSEGFQRPNLYNYMIMKNLDLATKKDLRIYMKHIKKKGFIYDNHSENDIYFAKRYYYAFFTNEDIGKIYIKFGDEIKNKQFILGQIAKVCYDRRKIDQERKKPLSKNQLIDLFYYSFYYPELQPLIEEYFIAIGRIELWSYWNYEYYNRRGNYFLASHYFQLYYYKLDKEMKNIVFYDYIKVRTKELEWLIAHNRNYEAYENGIELISILASVKDGLTDKYFSLVNLIKEALNDSSSVILEEILKSGDNKTYNRIIEQRDAAVLLILKRKF